MRWVLLVPIGLLTMGAVAPPLTPDGWGELKIGMREADAVRRFGLRDPDPEGVVNSFECRELDLPGQSQITVMAESGRITRISISSRGPIRTESGLRVGSTEAEVRKAYGAGLEVAPNRYDGPPARYLTSWVTRNERGIRYETDEQRRVARIHVGSASIEYVEGCL